MFQPRVQHPFRVPGFFLPLGLAILGVVAAVLAWGLIETRPIGREASFVQPGFDPARFRWLVYAVPGNGEDRLYVRSLDGGVPRLVAVFPSTFTQLPARGEVSPAGDAAAVLSVRGDRGTLAHMSLVRLVDGDGRDVDGRFDYLSPIAWRPDSRGLAAVRSTPPDEGGRVDTTVVEVDGASGAVVEVGVFEKVYQAAPVGYSVDGTRLYVVVVDRSGSSLWAGRRGSLSRVAMLSPGRTRDWRLSPDGARLAYVDILGTGERRYAGRTLLIATGSITRSVAADDEVGVVWEPRSEVPTFGGRGGGVRLSVPREQADYVVPVQWSPDGTTLVAAVYSASRDSLTAFDESIELVTPTSRAPLAVDRGARFFGWARELE